jgi:hypothetical protein
LLYPPAIGIGSTAGLWHHGRRRHRRYSILHHDFIHSAIPAIILVIIAWRHGSVSF